MIPAIGTMIAAYTFVRLVEITFKKYEQGGNIISVLAIIAGVIVLISWFVMFFSGLGD